MPPRRGAYRDRQMPYPLRPRLGVRLRGVGLPTGNPRTVRTFDDPHRTRREACEHALSGTTETQDEDVGAYCAGA